MFCLAGTRGQGGACDCTTASGWIEGEWTDPWCHQGKCYSGQNYGACAGKGLWNNSESLGDGTWCFNEERNTECQTGPSIYDYFLI